VVFAASFYLVGLALVAAEPLFKWLGRGLSRTENLVVSNSLADPVENGLIVLTMVFYLAAALYLAESRRTRELIQRWAAIAALAFLVFWSFDVATGDGPVSWRNRWATTSAGENRHADAARHWAWAVTRAPRDGSTAGLAVKGAREALLAGDAGLARSLLSRVDAELLREHPGGLEAGTARALLASRLDLGVVRSVKVSPVFQEGSLDTRWSALLTAARAVRPDLGETEVKQKLQDLSSSASSTDLPALSPLQQLRVVADLFGARATAFPWSERDRVLAAGVPVLLRVPPLGHWILVFWSAPGADAVIALDYSLWGMGEKEDLDKDEVARLLVGGEGPESRAARAQARVAVLRSASQLGAVLARDGGKAFALVSLRQSSAALPDLPSDLMTIELARREMERKAFRRGLTLGAQLPSGPARDELLAYAWLDPRGRSLLAGDEPAAAAVVGRLARGGLGSASPWLVGELVSQTWDARDPFCALRGPVLRASLALRPEESWHVLELARKAAAAGRSAEASDFALRSAASHNWASAFVLEALEPLALMPGAGSDPRARAGLERLLDRVPMLVGSQAKASEYTLRSSHPEYWAARAALSSDPDAAAERWRRAVELKPKSAPYRLRLAEALERAGRTGEAREARRWADAVRIEPLCPGARF
jgi:tetratricopeptide (TPR) repeat protein